MPFSKAEASCWVMAATFSLRPPSAGTGMAGLACATQPSSVNQSVTPCKAAPVCTASAARAGRHPRLLAEEVHLDAAFGEVPVAEQAHQVPGPQPPGEHAEHVRAGGQRQHLHAQALAEGEEHVEHRLGLDALRDRREFDATADDVAHGHLPLPMCGSAKMTPLPPATSLRARSASALICMSRRMRSLPIASSRNTSIQYRP